MQKDTREMILLRLVAFQVLMGVRTYSRIEQFYLLWSVLAALSGNRKVRQMWQMTRLYP